MVIASIAYRAGLVDAVLFSTLLMIGVATTVCTPLLLKLWQKRAASKPHLKPPVCKQSDGTLPGVDIDNSAALLDRMESR